MNQPSQHHAGTAWLFIGLTTVACTSQPGPRTALFHYDVVVAGRTKSAYTNASDPNFSGTTTITIEWTTTFKNVVLQKVRDASTDTFIVGHAAPGSIKGGTTDVQYTFEYAMEETPLYSGSRCQGTIQLSSLGTHLLIGGGTMNRTRTDFSFDTLLDPSAGTQLNTAMLNKTVDACNEQGFHVYRHSNKPWRVFAPAFPDWPVHDATVAVVRGLTIDRSITLLGVGATRHDPKGPLLSPLKELSIGDAFSFTTGEVQRSFSCAEASGYGGGRDSCSVTAMTEINVNVCKEGSSACISKPTVGDNPTVPSCQPPTVQRALMDPPWDQRQMKARQLEKDWKELDAANQALQDNLPAWRAAVTACAIEDILQKVITSRLKAVGGQQAAVIGVIGKMVTGDLSYMPQKEYGNVLDLLKMDAALLQTASGAGNPDAMKAKLDNCSALPENLQTAARAFVDAYARVSSLLPRLQRQVNDLRTNDQAYWDQWQAYYKACLEYGRCMGKPATDCPAPPAEPAGPIPGQKTSLPTRSPQ